MQERETTGRVMRGMSTLAQALRAESYPMDVHDIDYSVGDLEIQGGRGDWIAVRDLTERFERRDFASAEDVMAELRRVLGERSAAA